MRRASQGAKSNRRPRAASSPISISKADARRVWLRAQRLDRQAPFGDGPAATVAAVEHLGYVQIDTINVIERCHHHILFSRIPDYRRVHLEQAQATDKSVFEYWTHALSYVPTRDLRFFRRAMQREWKQRMHWSGGTAITSSELRRVLRRIEADGPLTIRDFDEEAIEKTHLWASRKPSKRTLQLGFYRGLLVISRRAGMLKTYELAHRHFGWETPPKAAGEREVHGYLLDRALRAQGIVSLDSICHLNARHKADVLRQIGARVRRQELVPVAIEGAERIEHWAEPQALDVSATPASPAVHILSPFDPLIIQRRRLQLLFDYEHLFEAYVPKPKRVLGYFALPVLVGDEIVAALDLKTDRAAGKVLIQKWSWMTDSRRRELKPRIEAALALFERFQIGD